VRSVRIQYAALLGAAVLLAAPVTGQAQVVLDMGDQQPATKKPAAKAKTKPAKVVQEPAIGGRVLSECSAVEASERLSVAMGKVKGVKDVRALRGQTVLLSYRGRDVNLAITAHGSCQASFQASLSYRARPGEEASIRRAYNALMEPAVAALAECDPTACLEANADEQANRREQAARQEAAARAEETQEAASQAGASPESAEQQAQSAAAFAYLQALSSEDAYKETVEIIREVLPTPLTARFPDAESKGVTVTLLDTPPAELGGGAELQALRSKVGGEALPSELQDRFEAVLAAVEEQINGPCYFVAGYVDFQNRCGALVRGRYEAYLSRREGSDWYAIGEPAVDFPDCPGR